MVDGQRKAALHVAGLIGLGGYGLLAIFGEVPEPRPWLWLAHGLGWLAVALAAGAGRISIRSGWVLIAWAIAFRLAGLAVAPAWEDDYHRYLWDGYVTTTGASPYARSPLDAFGRAADAPGAVQDALDQINHPDLPTVYGPAPQVAFGLAAWLVAGELWVLKLGWLGVEMLAWWLLWPRLRWWGAVLLLWCPLAVTEIGFAAHPEALMILAVAIFLRGWDQGRPGWLVGGAVLAITTKMVGLALIPFLAVRRGGWWAGLAVVLSVGCYLPFGVSGGEALGRSIGEMGRAFEYNSTGFALLQLAVGSGAARWGAAGLFLVSALLIWWWWRRRPDELPPVNAVWGVFFWWAPVFNPWYALWLLPACALRPTAWVIGVWWAVPIAYTHGWGSSAGLLVDYRHPGWARPVEVAVVVVVGVVGWLGREQWRRWRDASPMVNGADGQKPAE